MSVNRTIGSLVCHVSLMLTFEVNEQRLDKTCPRGFRPGPTQSGLGERDA